MSVVITRTYSGSKDLYMMSDNFSDACELPICEDVDNIITRLKERYRF